LQKPGFKLGEVMPNSQDRDAQLSPRGNELSARNEPCGVSRDATKGWAGTRWRWYRSRFMRPAIAVAVGGAAFLLSAIIGRSLGSDTDLTDEDSPAYPPLIVRIIVVPLGVPILFSPFVLWQLWNGRRARYTGHLHEKGAPLPPPGIVDVCDAASLLRHRGATNLAGRFGACVLVGIASGVTLSPIFAVVSLFGIPAVWSFAVIHEQRHHPAQRVAFGSGVGRARPTAGRSLAWWIAVVLLQVTGVFLIVLGWSIVALMIWAAPLALVLGLEAPMVELVFGWPVIVALFAVSLTGFSALARTGRRLRITATALANQARARPLVLYLRSFVDDRCLVASGGTEWWRLAEFFSFRARISLDEIIVRQLGSSSSVVSIAEPAAPRFYLPLGAMRRRVSGDTWREFVVARMHEASIIVMSVGSTEALLWELSIATKNGYLDRLLLVVPPGDDADVRLRWSASAAAMAEAGGPTLKPTVDSPTVALARMSGAGLRHVFVVDQLDESAYASAFAKLLALDTVGVSRT
jgi:hypothetical protein